MDDNLMYLRDALPEYSTIDVNMQPVPLSAHEEVPVNKVRARDCDLPTLVAKALAASLEMALQLVLLGICK